MANYLLVTGEIAAPALRKLAAGLPQHGLAVCVLPRAVAALLTTEDIARNLPQHPLLAAHPDYPVLIPGLAEGPLEPLAAVLGREVQRGPADLKDLPRFLDGTAPADLTATLADCPPSPIRIVAEIVDAPRLSIAQLLARAAYYRASGADYIDLGGSVGSDFPRLAQAIRALKQEGYRVCLDSHREADLRTAARVGVDLVLSFTSRNLELARLFDCPVVVIPDDGASLDSLYRNMEQLAAWGVPYLADPILPPLTLGLAESIGRYRQLRRDYPDCPALMGLGNVSELTDADSVGINTLLTGIATELGVEYLLSTEVSARCRGSIRELALARALCQQARYLGQPPKHLGVPGLLALKDARGNSYDAAELRELQQALRPQDRNFRIFVADQIYLFHGGGFYQGQSAEELYAQIQVDDPGHAFYLGRELQKAETALLLHKRYQQDSPLDWGYYNDQERG